MSVTKVNSHDVNLLGRIVSFINLTAQSGPFSVRLPLLFVTNDEPSLCTRTQVAERTEVTATAAVLELCFELAVCINRRELAMVGRR